MNLLREAAERRAKAVARQSDRPQQRRAAERSSRTRGYTPPIVGTLMELRSSTTQEGALEFVGQASVYDRAYEMWDAFGPYTESVDAFAGRESLANPELSVPLVIDHEPIRRMALTDNGSLRVWEDSTALHVHAPALDPTDPDVAYVAPKILSGLLSEMSFRFHITDGEWSPDFMEFRIRSYDIHRGDVSIVGYGANPFTSGSVRSEDASGRIRRAVLLDALRTA